MRSTLLKVFFAKPGTKTKRLNFEGPTVFARDNTQELLDVSLVQPLIGIDEHGVLYFLPTDKLEHGEFKGYYLLRERFSRGGDSDGTGEALSIGSTTIHEIVHEKLDTFAPRPTDEQMQNSFRGRGRQSYNETRFDNVNWDGLIRDVRDDQSARHLEADVQAYTRKRHMTTGNITLVLHS